MTVSKRLLQYVATLFILSFLFLFWQRRRRLLHELLSCSCSQLPRLLICALYLSNHVQYAGDQVHPFV